jgi:hypothetical protein
MPMATVQTNSVMIIQKLDGLKELGFNVALLCHTLLKKEKSDGFRYDIPRSFFMATCSTSG